MVSNTLILYYICIILKYTQNTNKNGVSANRVELLINTQLFNKMRFKYIMHYKNKKSLIKRQAASL